MIVCATYFKASCQNYFFHPKKNVLMINDFWTLNGWENKGFPDILHACDFFLDLTNDKREVLQAKKMYLFIYFYSPYSKAEQTDVGSTVAVRAHHPLGSAHFQI